MYVWMCRVSMLFMDVQTPDQIGVKICTYIGRTEEGFNIRKITLFPTRG
jgi:hypothetical protein